MPVTRREPWWTGSIRTFEDERRRRARHDRHAVCGDIIDRDACDAISRHHGATRGHPVGIGSPYPRGRLDGQGTAGPRATWNGAKLCATGMISIVLTLKWGGRPVVHHTVSATSSAVNGCIPA